MSRKDICDNTSKNEDKFNQFIAKVKIVQIRALIIIKPL